MIRPSLDPYTYLEHAKSTFFVAGECLKMFLELMDQPLSIEENRLKQIGFFRSTLLHYAITVELLLKALALYYEKQNIESGKLKTFKGFLKNLKEGKKNVNGHDFTTIIQKYKISFNKEELNFIESLQEYTIWAGRFPYPTDDNEIEKLENLNGSSGSPLSNDSQKIVKGILERVNVTLSEI